MFRAHIAVKITITHLARSLFIIHKSTSIKFDQYQLLGIRIHSNNHVCNQINFKKHTLTI
ncbi:hypothetical protein VCRA2110O3_30082 [Vibrio crassostreae]|nr:hypothetical protein VCRA2110O3_30082 [Vibrio crassostreae]CAK3873588.1 hypothetical protein VCRA2120E7_20154 [Vibrio crassostreae]